MSRFALGFWAGAALYAAVGVIGVFLIGTRPSIAFTSDGYGTIGGATAAKQPVVRP